MARKPLPKDTETAVLVRSRRRCCICFGIDRDTRPKLGQIAHLDKSNANHAESNLAFLCFEHHDEYDSISSQRKNYTQAEVKTFRDELYTTINKAFTQQVHFGEISTPIADPYAGTYMRIDSGMDGAELTLTPLPDTYEGEPQYFVSGFSTWGADRPYGPNIGSLSFAAAMTDKGTLRYDRGEHRDRCLSTLLTFGEHGVLRVVEDGSATEYGAGVTFAGIYNRAG